MTGTRIIAWHVVGATFALAVTTENAMSNGQGLSTMPIRGIVRPLNQASISIDIPVRVKKLHFREAEPFKKGDVLVTFDCTRLRSEHEALAAVYRAKRIELDRNAYLDKQRAVGRADVELARAEMQKAKAETQASKARLQQCQVVAPFDGKVAELTINEHELPVSGQAFITVVDERAFEIDLIVPSIWLRFRKANETFKFTIDETGLIYDAKVLRFGATVDPVSQTLKVTAVFAHRYQGVMAGMSGTAAFTELAASK